MDRQSQQQPEGKKFTFGEEWHMIKAAVNHGAT
jgi:hypothetical protein